MRLNVNGVNVNAIPMYALVEGEIGIIVENPYAGSIVFKVPGVDRVICFNANGHPDSFDSNAPHLVRILKTGENFTVTV